MGVVVVVVLLLLIVTISVMAIVTSVLLSMLWFLLLLPLVCRLRQQQAQTAKSSSSSSIIICHRRCHHDCQYQYLYLSNIQTPSAHLILLLQTASNPQSLNCKTEVPQVRAYAILQCTEDVSWRPEPFIPQLQHIAGLLATSRLPK